MTLKDMGDILSSTKLPVVQGKWREEPALPYIVYSRPFTSNFGADNIAYKKINHIDILLFSKDKDEASEKLIEDALTNNGIFYEITDELFMEDENVYRVVYEVKIL